MADSGLTLCVLTGENKKPDSVWSRARQWCFVFLLTPDAISSHHHRRATPCHHACVRTAFVAEIIGVRLEERFIDVRETNRQP